MSSFRQDTTDDSLMEMHNIKFLLQIEKSKNFTLEGMLQRSKDKCVKLEAEVALLKEQFRSRMFEPSQHDTLFQSQQSSTEVCKVQALEKYKPFTHQGDSHAAEKLSSTKTTDQDKDVSSEADSEDFVWKMTQRKKRLDSKKNPDTLSLHLAADSPEAMTSVKDEDLNKFFSRFGKVLSVHKPIDYRTKKPVYYAFIRYSTHAEVEKALETRGCKIRGIQLSITPSH